MKSARIRTALAATLLLAAPSGSDRTWAAEPWGRSVPRACMSDVQKCVEKFEARLRLYGHAHDGIGIERALLELYEMDPECALLMQSTGGRGP